MDTSDRKFFEHYAAPSGGDEPKLVRVYACPCCGYPTLSEPAGYEICDICSWEDDGGDGYGPNAYSLEEAGAHFRQYLTSRPSWRLSDAGLRPWSSTSPSRTCGGAENCGGRCTACESVVA